MDPLPGVGVSGAGPGPVPARGAGAPRTAAELARLKEALRGFEAIFIREIVKGMRQPAAAGGLLAPGPGRQLYQDIADEELARSLARNGGIGVADFMVRHLSRREQEKGSSPVSAEPMKPHRSTDLATSHGGSAQ